MHIIHIPTRHMCEQIIAEVLKHLILVNMQYNIVAEDSIANYRLFKFNNCFVAAKIGKVF